MKEGLRLLGTKPAHTTHTAPPLKATWPQQFQHSNHNVTPECGTGSTANTDILYSEITERGLLFTWSGISDTGINVFSRMDPERKGLCYFAERAMFKTTKLHIWVSPLGT